MRSRPRGAGTALSLLLAATAVACQPNDPVLRRSEQARAVEQVFASDEPYSPRRLEAGDIPEFLQQRAEYRGDSAVLEAFYERRGNQYAWLVRTALTANAESFVALAGLGAGPIDTLDFSCASCVRDAELWLTAEFFRFARRDYGGHFERDPRELQWFIPRAKKDYTQLLDSLAAGTMDLSALEPMHPLYAQLRAAVAPMRSLAALPWDSLALPRGLRSLAPGDSAAVLPRIRERLALLGDFVGADADSGSMRYDGALVVAVQRFQRRHGLREDAVIGAGVLRALNVSPAERLRTLLVNMERLRWVPDQTPARAIVVNIPEFRLRVLEGGEETLTMPIVVGATATKTVVFADSVTSVVFSPTWTVPASITRKEILPAMRRDPNYLARNQMDIIGGSESLPLIRQRPGPHNALGLVKFSFPNPYGIFMHDTPARGLFALEQRAFSHGCIRLAQPQALAEYLLGSDSTWTVERMQVAMRSGRETAVRLKEPMPVYLVYFTAWVDREGALNFRDDVYGHDKRLGAELFVGDD